jgi:hypothetical protein
MRKTILVLFICLLASSALCSEDPQEEVTLVTYYPAPYGDYTNLYSDTVTFTPQANAPATPSKGMMFFGKVDTADPAEGVYVWSGEDWLNVIAEPAEEDVIYGGYSQINDFDYNTLYPNADSYKFMPGVWGLINPLNKIRPYPIKDNYYGFSLNFRGLPAGIYVFTYTAQLDVDQYVGPKKTVNKQALVAYMRAVEKTSDSAIKLDETERFIDETFEYDTSDPLGHGGSLDWSDTGQFTAHAISRTFTRQYNKGPTTKDKWRYYVLQVNRQKASPYMNVRVCSAQLTVKFIAD